MKKIVLATAVLALAFLPLLAGAAGLPDVWSPASIKGPLLTCHGGPVIFDSSGNPQPNPDACQNLCNLVLTIVTDIYVAIAFVIWIILPISFTTGGIMYMLGGANPSLLETAKKTLWGAVIGALIVICSYMLISTFLTFMKITGVGGFNGSPACTITEHWTGQDNNYV
jgi:hypothetical protein